MKDFDGQAAIDFYLNDVRLANLIRPPTGI